MGAAAAPLRVKGVEQSKGFDPFTSAKEHRHLLALALEGATGGQNLLGEVTWGVGARGWWRYWFRGLNQRLPAPAAELDSGRVLEPAVCAPELKRGAALAAKLYAARVLETEVAAVNASEVIRAAHFLSSVMA
jgi:hypothetical protein